MKSILALSCLFLLAPLALSEKSYEGYKTYKVKFSSREQAKILQNLGDGELIDLWRIYTNGNADIMVSPSNEDVLDVIRSKGMEIDVWMDNVQDFIESSRNGKKEKQGKAILDEYHNYTDIIQLENDLVANSDIAAIEDIGKTYEGRSMYVVKICRGGCGNKPAMFVQAGIHAREWIGPATTLYALNQLLDAENSALLDSLDWYVLSVVNPDGYEYTWNVDRMWRKTRSPRGTCVGVDANRNYGYCWNTGGSSDYACTDTYHGPTAFSEVELRNIDEFVKKTEVANNLKFFVDIHSYSELVILPYGASYDGTLGDDAACVNIAPNADERLQKARNWAKAMTPLYGIEYKVGNVVEMLYEASGGSFDYFLGTLGIKYSLGMELRDKGEYGFLLPEDQIIPNSEEVWAFLKAAANDIATEFNNS